MNTEYIIAIDPKTKTQLDGKYPIASEEVIDKIVQSAHEAGKTYRHTSGTKKTELLRTIAEEIESLGDVLVHRVMAESGLPEARVIGERGRTCGQLRMFADLVEEGSWVEAIIDEALPEREPLPRVDLRKMLVGIGPVAVFGASNFPLAYSTAGGDTASALAAGCPVIVKGHPSHPGTNALVGMAIRRALDICRLPEGIFSYVDGGTEVGSQLVMHPHITAVGFTGSLKGGRAIMDAANRRHTPIPVYAEMGSINPIFLLPSKMQGNLSSLCDTLANSINMGAGQFCTNPGVIVILDSPNKDAFIEQLGKAFEGLSSFPMLNNGIFNHYEECKLKALQEKEVEVVYNREADDRWLANPTCVTTTAKEFVNNRRLHSEVFGPFTIVVICKNAEEMSQVAASLDGQLTATIMGTEEELTNSRFLIDRLTEKVGRLIFNGVPTGVEVCNAMHHGGPYPASSNGIYTSVGTGAIRRFARPVCYQNAVDAILPAALKRDNPLEIWRKVNGKMVK